MFADKQETQFENSHLGFWEFVSRFFKVPASVDCIGWIHETFTFTFTLSNSKQITNTNTKIHEMPTFTSINQTEIKYKNSIMN